MKLDRTNSARLSIAIAFIIMFSMIWWPGQDVQKVVLELLVIAGSIYLGFISRRKHPKEKSFMQLFRIVWLKVRIFILKSYLSRYPDLKKHRGNPRVKEEVWQHRDKLKELKAELKALVK